MELIITTKLELEEIIAKAVRESIVSYLADHKEKESISQNLSIKEVALKLGVTQCTVRNYIKRGNIKAFKLGGRIFIDRNQLDSALKEVKSLKYRRD